MKKHLVLIIWLIPFLSQGQTFEIDSEKFPGKYREFDFWIGEWDVNLRRIQSDNTWQDWKQSQAEIYSILDGRAILELWEEKGSGGMWE